MPHDPDLDKFLPQLSSKTNPVGADYTYLTDTEDSNISKKLSLDDLQNNFIIKNYSPFKRPCLVATNSNITLSGEQTINGILTNSSRVLVRSQTNKINNGVYLSSSGSWTREPDCQIGMDIFNNYFSVIYGAGSGFYEIYVVGQGKSTITGDGTCIVGTDEIDFNGGFNPVNLKINGVMASLLVGSDSDGNLISLNSTDGYPTLDEIKFVSGATSNIQDQIDSISSPPWEPSEMPSGVINGSNTEFVLSRIPILNSQSVYKNGLFQDLVGDYTITSDTINFISAPVVGDKIRVKYQY